MNAAAAIRRPSSLLSTIHHRCQMQLSAVNPPPPLLLPPIAIFASVALPPPRQIPSPHPLNARCLLSCCRPLPTLSNATAHCHRYTDAQCQSLPSPSSQFDCCTHTSTQPHLCCPTFIRSTQRGAIARAARRPAERNLAASKFLMEVPAGNLGLNQTKYD